jgi:hypothetical protein
MGKCLSKVEDEFSLLGTASPSSPNEIALEMSRLDRGCEFTKAYCKSCRIYYSAKASVSFREQEEEEGEKPCVGVLPLEGLRELEKELTKTYVKLYRQGTMGMPNHPEFQQFLDSGGYWCLQVCHYTHCEPEGHAEHRYVALNALQTWFNVIHRVHSDYLMNPLRQPAFLRRLREPTEARPPQALTRTSAFAMRSVSQTHVKFPSVPAAPPSPSPFSSSLTYTLVDDDDDENEGGHSSPPPRVISSSVLD